MEDKYTSEEPTMKRAKDLRDFLQTVDSFTDGQVQVVEVDWDCLSYVHVNVKPNEGPYRGGEYRFRLEPGTSTVTSICRIPHPNILGHSVCVRTEDGEMGSTLERTLLSVLFLMHQPDYDRAYDMIMPLNEDWYRTIRVALTGRHVRGFEGPRYIEDDDEIRRFLKEIEEEQKVERSKLEAETQSNGLSNEVETTDQIENGHEVLSNGDVSVTDDEDASSRSEEVHPSTSDSDAGSANLPESSNDDGDVEQIPETEKKPIDTKELLKQLEETFRSMLIEEVVC